MLIHRKPDQQLGQIRKNFIPMFMLTMNTQLEELNPELELISNYIDQISIIKFKNKI